MPYVPIINISATPTIQVTMVGAVTYNEFINSLSQNQYKVNNIFFEADGYQQLQQSYQYNIFDSNGQQYTSVLKPKTDPYQKQPALYLDVSDQNIILNGLSTILFNMLPGTLTLALCCERVSVNDYFPAGTSNLDNADDSLGNLELFNEFTDCL